MGNTSIIIIRIIPSLMILMGSGMALIWAKDILSGKFSGQENFFKWKEDNTLLWPHIVAEYLTAFGLIAGGTGLIVSGSWALPVSFLAFCNNF